MSDTTDQSPVAEVSVCESVWPRTSECAVCGKQLEASSRPQLLPCCHSSCGDCIDDNNNQLKEWNTSNNTTDKPQFKCKLCDQEYNPEECIENLFLMKYWAKNESTTETHICQSCDGENKTAVVRCEECGWVCNDCEGAHKKFKALKEHKFDESTRVSTPDRQKSNICEIHNEEITVYCKSCRQPYCARCILKDHNVHVYEDTKDGTQLESFFKMMTSSVDRIKEKRTYSEEILDNFNKFEPQLSASKEECTEKVKALVAKLYSKVKELGNNLLERVNSVCEKKVNDFNNKKAELKRLNDSLKYIEEFMTALLAMDEPMDLMKSQDLLFNQIQLLLNQPCSQPDFDKRYKVEVMDRLNHNGRDFDFCRMIDNIFQMPCYVVSTKEDEANQERAKRLSGEEEVTIIGQTSNATSKQSSAATYSRVGQSSTAVTLPNILRGNRYVGQTMSADTRRASLEALSSTNANPMPSHYPSAPTVASNHMSLGRIYQSPMQAIADCANSLPQSMQSMQSMPNRNNFVPQTGVITAPTYANLSPYQMPYQTQTQTTSRTVQNIPCSTQSNYINGNSGNYGIVPVVVAQTTPSPQSTCAQNGTTRPTVHHYRQSYNQSAPRPAASQLTQGTTLLNQLTANPNPIRGRPPLRRSPPQQQPQSAEELRQANIQALTEHLKSPLTVNQATRWVEQIMQTHHLVSSPPNTNASATLLQTTPNTMSTPTPSPQQSIPVTGSYQLHLPEPTVNESIVAIVTTTSPVSQPQRSSSIDSISQSPSARTPPTTPLIETPVANQPIVTTAQQTCTPSPPPLPSTVQNLVDRTNTESSAQKTTSDANSEKTSDKSNPTPDSASAESGVPDPTHNTILPTLDNDDLFSELSPNSIREGSPLSVIDSPETSPVSSAQLTPEDTMSLAETPPIEAVNQEEVTTGEASPTKEDNTENIENRRGSQSSAVQRNGTIPAPNVDESVNGQQRPSIEEIDLINDDDSDDANLDNEDEVDCLVCSNQNGEFICCGQCPRGFHLECHVPSFGTSLPQTSFTCSICTNPVTTGAGKARKNGLTDYQQKMCEKLMLHMLCHHRSRPLKQSDRSDDEISKYPINLVTIRTKLEAKQYRDEKEFIEDYKRMFKKFKNKDMTADERLDIIAMEKFFKKKVRKLMPAFADTLNDVLHLIDSNVGTSAKKSKSSCLSL